MQKIFKNDIDINIFYNKIDFLHRNTLYLGANEGILYLFETAQIVKTCSTTFAFMNQIFLRKSSLSSCLTHLRDRGVNFKR